MWGLASWAIAIIAIGAPFYLWYRSVKAFQADYRRYANPEDRQEPGHSYFPPHGI